MLPAPALFEPSPICFVEDVRVDFSESENLKVNRRIAHFANRMGERRQSAEHYVERRNANPRNTWRNQAESKKSEYVVRRYLCGQHRYPQVEIDFEVREGIHKGWKPDLPFSDSGIGYPDVHVKSCSRSVHGYVGDFTWTFQLKNKDGRGGRDPLFGLSPSARDLVAFVFLETWEARTGIIKAIVPWNKIVKFLRDPKKPNLAGIKKCLYHADLLLDEEEIVKHGE